MRTQIALVLRKLAHSITKPVEFLDYDTYREQVEVRANHKFQQDTRKQSLRNITKDENFFY